MHVLGHNYLTELIRHPALLQGTSAQTLIAVPDPPNTQVKNKCCH